VRYLARVSKDTHGWLITFPDAPGCQTQADTREEILAVATEALEGWLESWLITGEAPPRPKLRAGRGLAVEVDPALAIAIELRWARLEQGMTQAELAARVGVSQPQIAMLEKPGQNPSIQTIKKVAKALGARPVITFEQMAVRPIALERARRRRRPARKAS